MSRLLGFEEFKSMFAIVVQCIRVVFGAGVYPDTRGSGV